MKYYFNIAGIYIYIQSSFEIHWNKYIQAFLCNKTDSIDEYYEIVLTDLINPTGKEMYHDDNRVILIDNNDEQRLHFFVGYETPAMLYKEYSNKKVIYLNKLYLSAFTTNNNYCIFNALAFEKVLINHNAIVLHCSYIIDNNEAILFTAPSGTGKSTQAELWKQYRNATIVNGDRAIIKKINNVYYAMGMPICGSSDTCLNISVPIKAIVYLGQSSTNIINLIDEKNMIKRLVSETTINFFNTDFLNQALEIIQDLAKNVNMYELLCTKDENAVKCLEEVINK